MANFKFFNIGKANEEITRLEAELATATAANANVKENCAAVEANAESLQAELLQARADLATAKASVASTGAALEVVKAELNTAKEQLANPSDEIKKKVAAGALAIAQAQGIPPLASKGAEANQPGAGDVLAQHAALKDPAQKQAFYRKNKAAYDAAWRIANPHPPQN